MIQRATGLLVLEVRSSNPNGNPDREGDPRQRPDERGEISPVSVKRKIRDLIADKKGPVWEEAGRGLKPEEFWISESRDMTLEERQAMLRKDMEKFKRTFWDGRIFGNTILEEGMGKSIRTGVAHFGVGLSVAPIDIERSTFTKKVEAEKGKDRGMAPMGFRVVSHGVYTVPFFVNPTAAEQSGCQERDVELLYKIIPYIYDHTRSMIRSMVGILHAHVVGHKSALGSFSDFQMIDALTPMKKDEIAKPTRIEDYKNIPTWKDVPEALQKKAKWYRDLME